MSNKEVHINDKYPYCGLWKYEKKQPTDNTRITELNSLLEKEKEKQEGNNKKGKKRKDNFQKLKFNPNITQYDKREDEYKNKAARYAGKNNMPIRNDEGRYDGR